MKKILLLCFAMLLTALPAHAERIGLFNTGVDDSGALLPGGAVDPHYVITAENVPVPTGYGEPTPLPGLGTLLASDLPAYVIHDVYYWVANGPYSKWLAPSPGTYGDSALFTYTTTFDMTDLDLATAAIQGSWAVDDPGWMFLNGQLVAELPFGWMFQQLYGLQVAPNNPAYTANHDFLLTDGFLPGINTLQFLVWNSGGGPTGVRVEIASATAEPAIRNVTLDVKPGSGTDPINLGSKGKIPAAILSTAAFNAVAETDIATLTFGATGDEASLAFCNTAGEDVNGDGLPDLVCHFYTGRAGFTADTTQAILKGRTLSGFSMVGQDSVTIVP